LSQSPNGVICFIGLGSNLGRPLDRCLEAVEHLRLIRNSQVLRTSSFYRTEPVGPVDQDLFINAVIEMRTSLTVGELMRELQIIEMKMGREKTVKWGPRIIDLDILLYGQEIIKTGIINVPHPELHKRRFVMEPLYEIAPYAIHPAYGVSVTGLMERLTDMSKVEKI
jgi:2-amino-4-hydroxy-6-hydroxymethyldihydropteridine diphosphokinase